MSFHAVGQAPLPNFYGPGPAGVPNPYSGRVHNYPTRYHGPIYTRPMYKLPERRNPIEWGGGPEGYSGVGCLPCAGYGDIPAAIPGWAWGAAAPGSTDYQNALNAELAKLGYATIGVDGKLGGQTCGAVEVLTAEGIAVPIPGSCYPSGGMLGPDGKKRMWTAAGGGKSYAHPERVSAPAPQQQTEQPKTAEEPQKVITSGGGGSLPAPPSPWPWSGFSAGGAGYQDAVNAELTRLGYASIGPDGKLGPGTCGATETLASEGVSLTPPAACYPANGIKGPDGRARMWTSASGGKSYPHPAFVGMPKEEPKKTAEAPTKVVTGDVCAIVFGQASQLAKEIQQQLNAVLAANGYESIPVTGVFDALTAGALKLAGTSNQGGLTPPPASCAWEGIRTDMSKWPANPPMPKKKKGKAKAKQAPKCFIEYGKKSGLAKKVQKWMNKGLAKNGYITIAVTGRFDAATAGVIRLIKGPDPAGIAGAGQPPCDPLQWPKANDAQIAAAPLPQKKPVKQKKAAPKHEKKRPHKATPQVVRCGSGFHVEGRKCVKNIVVGPIATHAKRKKHGGGKKPAAPSAAAQASMFASPVVWVGGVAVLGGLAWFLTRKKSGAAIKKAA